MAIYENVASLVNDAINASLEATTQFTDYAPASITLPAVDFTATITGEVPVAPTYSVSAPPTANITGDLDRALYTAASSVIGAMSIDNLPSILNYESPAAAEPLPNLPLPDWVGDAPETGFITVEDSAGLSDIDAPVVAVGIPPDMLPIPELSFDAYGIDKLDVTMPVPGVVPDISELANPDQLVVQLDPALLDAITTALSGQDIMPIQDQLYRLATHDRRYEVIHAERTLFVDSASRGFGDSNGPLAERIADMLYEAAKQDGGDYEKGRDSLYEQAKLKLVEALQQSIALETANFAVYLSYASKLVEVFQINIELHKTLFSIVIDMYETQIKAVNSVIQAYNTYVGATIVEQRAEVAEIKAAQAVLTTNQARVQMYASQGKTAGVRADIYSTDVDQQTLSIDEFGTYISGLLMNVDIQKQNIVAYKDSLSAYSDSVKVDRRKIDAYGAEVRTTGSVVDVYKENWDLYSAAQTALSKQNSSVGNFNRSSLQALTAEIGVFRNAAEQQKSYLRGVSRWLTENSGIVRDYTSAVRQVVSFVRDKNASIVGLEEASVRIGLADADMASTQSALDAQRAAAQATIDAGLLASEATLYAGQAQAAYSVRSISAALGSTSSDGDTRSFTSSATEGQQYTRSYSLTNSIKGNN
jgi:hypothetical protein